MAGASSGLARRGSGSLAVLSGATRAFAHSTAGRWRVRAFRTQRCGIGRQGRDMRFCSSPRSFAWLLAAGLLLVAEWSFAQRVPGGPKAATAGDYQAKAEAICPGAPRLRGGGRRLLALDHREAARAHRQAPQQRAGRARRLRADAAAGLSGAAAAGRSRLRRSAIRPSRASRTFRWWPIFSRRPPSNSASCRSGRRARSHSSAPMPRSRRPPA